MSTSSSEAGDCLKIAPKSTPSVMYGGAWPYIALLAFIDGELRPRQWREEIEKMPAPRREDREPDLGDDAGQSLCRGS